MGLNRFVRSKFKKWDNPIFLNYNDIDLSNNKDHIFIACMPKSGSTFLSNALTKITGYKKVAYRLNPIDNIYEHEVYLPAVYHSKDENTVTQQHARGSKTNFEILSRLSAFVLVQTRNIFDVVVSTYDHSENSKKTGSTMAYANDEYFKLPKDVKLKMIIDIVVPWHVHFYVSWFDRMQHEDYSKMIWLSYEELIKDETKILDQLLNFCEISKSQNEIEQTIKKVKGSKVKSRFNKGLIGRGGELSEEVKSKIISYTDYYPWVDFSKIGITK